jgi:hypothetical protein
MEPQAIRITIELPQGAEVQTADGMTGDLARGAGVSATSRAIDAGAPPAALLEALGDPATSTTVVEATDATTRGLSDEAIDAGSFPTRLAAEMEAQGPRHPFGHPDTGTATAMSPVLSRESRN